MTRDQAIDPPADRTDGTDGTQRLAQVRDSAGRWHTLQLGALGFVGLCGVLKGDDGGDLPRWLQTGAGLAAVAALVVAGLSILLVATVAWPLVVVRREASAESAARRLRTGVALTFVAVALTSASAGASWWPRTPPQAGCEVRVATAAGVVCGHLE